MFDPKSLLNDLLGSQIPGTGTTVRDTAGKATQLAKDNPLAAGALVAVLLGTDTGRQVGGAALKLGGIAAIGGLAYKAYQNYKNGDKPADAAAQDPALLPPPEDTAFHPSQAPQGEAEFALTLVRAMIAAANADRHIDEGERKKIADKLALSGIGPEAEQFLNAEIEKPLSIDESGQGGTDRRPEARALYRLASDHRPRHARRARLSRPAGRPAGAAGRADRPCRGDGLGGQDRGIPPCRRSPRAIRPGE